MQDHGRLPAHYLSLAGLFNARCREAASRGRADATYHRKEADTIHRRRDDLIGAAGKDIHQIVEAIVEQLTKLLGSQVAST